MNKKFVLGTLILTSLMIGFSGCSQKVACVSADNHEIRVDVLEDGMDSSIIVDRWNPFSGGWFSSSLAVSENDIYMSKYKDGVIADRTIPGIFNLFGAKKIILDGNEDKVYLGEDSYKCNDDLSNLTALIRKIDQAKTDDRIRRLKHEF